MCGFRQAASSPEDAHSPQMGRVCVRVCVCVSVGGRLWVCEQEGHGPWVCPGVCPKPALEHSLPTACFLSAGPWCPQPWACSLTLDTAS